MGDGTPRVFRLQALLGLSLTAIPTAVIAQPTVRRRFPALARAPTYEHVVHALARPFAGRTGSLALFLLRNSGYDLKCVCACRTCVSNDPSTSEAVEAASPPSFFNSFAQAFALGAAGVRPVADRRPVDGYVAAIGLDRTRVDWRGNAQHREHRRFVRAFHAPGHQGC